MKKFFKKVGITFGICFGVSLVIILGLAAGPMGAGVMSQWLIKPVFVVSIILTGLIMYKSRKKGGK